MFTSLLSIFPNPLDVKGVSALSQNDFSPYPNPLPIATHLKVAIVNCDTPVPTIKTSHGEYSNLFIETLTSAASRLRSSHNLHITFTFSTFDAVTDYLPNPADGYSAIIISGSSFSAYDTDAWILVVQSFIRTVYFSFPSTKLLGSCFGHQILSQTLIPAIQCRRFGKNWTFGSFPSVVHKNPFGRRVGLIPITIAPELVERFGPLPGDFEADGGKSMEVELQFVHGDVVQWIPELWPEGWVNVGQSVGNSCEGVYEEGRIWTHQGHMEFSEEVNRITIEEFGWEGVRKVMTDAKVKKGQEGREVASGMAGEEGEIGRRWVAEGWVRFMAGC